MADALTSATGATLVTDHRPQPRGVLPRRMQTWVMVAVAGGMLLIMFVVGRPQPATRTAAMPSTPAPSTANSDRLRQFQDQLRIMETRAAQTAQAAAGEPAPLSTDPPPAHGTTAASDPIAADRKRREYESLFAGNVVVSRRPPDQQLAGNGAALTPGVAPLGAREPSTPAPPNLDDVANAVVRATARYGAATSTAPVGPAAPALPATQGSGSVPIASSNRALMVSASTDPIDPAAPMQRLLEGTVIETVLTNRLDGANASPVNCLVTTPVYSQSGQQVLIPAGARVLGEIKAVQSVGESRLAVAFHRLLFPDGRSVSLDQFTGLNQAGDAALRDHVNHHYWSTFGAASAVGVISGLGQYLGTVGFGGSGDRAIVIAGGFGNATSEATALVMNRFLNRLPTITIREGHRVDVYLTSDLELPVYEARPLLAPPARARVP